MLIALLCSQKSVFVLYLQLQEKVTEWMIHMIAAWTGAEEIEGRRSLT